MKIKNGKNKHIKVGDYWGYMVHPYSPQPKTDYNWLKTMRLSTLKQ